MESPSPGHAPSPTAAWIRWAVILLSLPALLPLAGALIVPYLHNRVPTGFIEYDLPSYLAEGRAYFDRGFHLAYSNPYAGYDSPAIYFQPQTFLLGLIQQLRLDPGVTFNLFGLMALFFTASMAVLFYKQVVGLQTTARKIGLVCFFWGGGIFTLVGLMLTLARRAPLMSVFEFEPTWGWWMLNFGRNLIYPTEAFYHGVFLLSLLLLIRRRLAWSLACAALLCCSHPFTGLALILILIAYSALELVMRSGVVNLRFLFVAILIAVLHLTYYKIWLNRFSDHRVLQAQWQKAWLYPPKVFIAALIIVGCLAIWRIAKSSSHCFRDPQNRLFAVWFLVVFALTQHNLVMRPTQPIHFAHGYDWMALFFLGAPVLIAALDFLLKISSPLLRMAALALFLSFFLLDNAAWLAKIAIHNEYLVSLTKDQSSTLTWLRKNVQAGDIVVCQDELISYLVSTYSPALSWQGHEHNTPYMEQRHQEVERAFTQGVVLPQWKRHGIVYVSPASWSPPADLSLQRRYANDQFAVWVSP